MSSPLYRDSPLTTQASIRLLEVTANCLAYDKPSYKLSYSLTVFEIQNIPPYSALSYTWGNPLPSEGSDDDVPWLKESHSIDCNGYSVGIRPNLFEGLISLAKLGFHGYLWIDALCIDQKTLAERNSQVSLMGKIYSKAAEIIVWLGKESRDTEGIVWLHNHFIPELRNKLGIQPHEFQKSDAVRDLEPLHCQELGLDSPTLHAQSYVEFCRRSWFSRAWIVQEVAVASSIKLVIGNVPLAWWNILNLAHLVQANRASIGHFFKTKLHVPNPSNAPRLDVARLQQARLLCHNEARELNRAFFQKLAGSNANAAFRATFLMWYANQNRICKCTDERDKIYAILGMLDHIFPLETENEGFYPCYDHSVETVFSDAVCWSMRHAPFLLPLSLVEERSRRKIKNLPSWVPDFSSNPCSNVLALRGIYNAPGDHLSTTIVTTIDFPALKTPGVSLDIIVATVGLDLQVVGGVERVLSLCANLNQTYHNDENRLEALWRTMIANNCVVDGGVVCPAPQSMAHSFQTWILSRVILCKARPLYQDAEALFLALHGQFDKSGTIEVALKQACGTLETLAATNETPPDMPTLEDIKHLVRFGDGYKTVENPGPIYPSASVFGNLLQRSTGFDEAFGSATHERCLYMTKQGFIGLGPLSTEPSDQVWMLQAAKVPFILRPMDRHGKFNLIGETYVHGFMDGEFAAAGLFHGWMEIDLV
jgi:hypothetical protein